MDADTQSDLCQSSISTCEDSSVWMRCPEHDGVKGNDRADRLAGQACSHSTVELDTLPAAVKPRASKLRSPGGEGRGKRKRTTTFLERTRKGHLEPDQHWNCPKSHNDKCCEKWGGTHKGLPERVDIFELN